MSRGGSLRANRDPERADVDRAHALICTGATARPGRDTNTCRRGASNPGAECGRSGGLRSCDHAVQVPAVLLVHVSARVPQIRAGHSSCVQRWVRTVQNCAEHR